MSYEYDGIESMELSVTFDHTQAIETLDHIFGGLDNVFGEVLLRGEMLQNIDEIAYTGSTYSEDYPYQPDALDDEGFDF